MLLWLKWLFYDDKDDLILKQIMLYWNYNFMIVVMMLTGGGGGGWYYDESDIYLCLNCWLKAILRVFFFLWCFNGISRIFAQEYFKGNSWVFKGCYTDSLVRCC